jgi:hypothetical protein
MQWTGLEVTLLVYWTGLEVTFVYYTGLEVTLLVYCTGLEVTSSFVYAVDRAGSYLPLRLCSGQGWKLPLSTVQGWKLHCLYTVQGWKLLSPSLIQWTGLEVTFSFAFVVERAEVTFTFAFVVERAEITFSFAFVVDKAEITFSFACALGRAGTFFSLVMDRSGSCLARVLDEVGRYRAPGLGRKLTLFMFRVESTFHYAFILKTAGSNTVLPAGWTGICLACVVGSSPAPMMRNSGHCVALLRMLHVHSDRHTLTLQSESVKP